MTETPGSGAYGQVSGSQDFVILASRPWVTGLWRRPVRWLASSPATSTRDFADEVLSKVRLGFGLVEDELGFIDPEPARRGLQRIGLQLRQRR